MWDLMKCTSYAYVGENGRHVLHWSPIQMCMANMQKVIPMGHLYGVTIDIEGERALANFKVIEIVDENNPYSMLLGIDQAFDMDAMINLKK